MSRREDFYSLYKLDERDPLLGKPKKTFTSSLFNSQSRQSRQSRQAQYQAIEQEQRQSIAQIPAQRQAQRQQSQNQPIAKLRTLLGLQTNPSTKSDIDKKIDEITLSIAKYKSKTKSIKGNDGYSDSKNNYYKIIDNLKEQLTGYETYKKVLNKAYKQGKGDYILTEFERMKEKIKVLEKLEKLYNRKHELNNMSYWYLPFITKKNKELVTNFILQRIEESITILEESDKLDTFIELITDAEYNEIIKYLNEGVDMPLHILNVHELYELFENLERLFSYSKINETEKALLMVEIKKVLEILLKENKIQFKELLGFELLTKGILTIKDLNDILTIDDLIYLKKLLEEYEHSDLKDLQKLKGLYDKRDGDDDSNLLKEMLKEVESDVSGGRKASVKKEICGKLRCIYKISGSRKEHVKYKGRLITVADYKRIHKIHKA